MPWIFDPMACQADIDALDPLLASEVGLSERDDILPFFRDHPNLAAFLGSYNPNVNTYDRLGAEVALFGAFTADFVAGDWSNHAYCFVACPQATRFSARRRMNGNKQSGYIYVRHHAVR